MALMGRMEDASSAFLRQADLVCSITVEKLNTLIADRNAARQMFFEEKQQCDSELAKVK